MANKKYTMKNTSSGLVKILELCTVWKRNIIIECEQFGHIYYLKRHVQWMRSEVTRHHVTFVIYIT